MRKCEATMATTHLDAHGDITTKEALVDATRQINASYVPLGKEHDPRIPPHGRWIAARVHLLEDGECELRGLYETFEPGEVVPFANDGREVPLTGSVGDPLHLTFDRTFYSNQTKPLLERITTILGSEPRVDIKKSFDPISVLAIAGTFVLGSIAVGFFQQIGSDAAEKLVEALKQIVGRKNRSKEQLFCFRAYFDFQGRPVEAEVILTNPTPQEIQYFFSKGLAKLDIVVDEALRSNQEVKRMIFELKNGKISFSFAIRRDAFPTST